MLGPDRARRLRENPDKVIFKYKRDGTPLSLSFLVPYEPDLCETITQRIGLIKERVDAEPYATLYPHRSRATAVAKMFIMTSESEHENDVQITFLPCALSHFNHFFDRTPYREWLDL